MALRLGVIETGRPPEGLEPRFGTYPRMIADWLAPLQPRLFTVALLDGAALPAPEAADLWVITGSRHGVDEAHDWIAPLETFIRAVAASGKRMIGICFGHQIIAQAMGGQVSRASNGWGLGMLHHHAVDEQSLPDAPNGTEFSMFHRDQVITPPEGARVLAGSASCPNAILHYPGFALSFQGHPEFSRAYMRALIDARAGTAFEHEDAERARATLDGARGNSHDWANWIATHWQAL